MPVNLRHEHVKGKVYRTGTRHAADVIHSQDDLRVTHLGDPKLDGRQSVAGGARGLSYASACACRVVSGTSARPSRCTPRIVNQGCARSHESFLNEMEMVWTRHDNCSSSRCCL